MKCPAPTFPGNALLLSHQGPGRAVTRGITYHSLLLVGLRDVSLGNHRCCLCADREKGDPSWDEMCSESPFPQDDSWGTKSTAFREGKQRIPNY